MNVSFFNDGDGTASRVDVFVCRHDHFGRRGYYRVIFSLEASEWIGGAVCIDAVVDDFGNLVRVA